MACEVVSTIIVAKWQAPYHREQHHRKPHSAKSQAQRLKGKARYERGYLGNILSVRYY